MELHYVGTNTGSIQMSHVEVHRLCDAGCFDLVKWLKCVEASQILVGYSILNVDPTVVWPSKKIFTVTQDVEFTAGMLEFIQKLYSNTTQSYQRPVELLHTTKNVKKSSMIWVCQVKDVLTGITIMKSSSVMVLVNLKTRLPVVFPNEFRHFVEQCSIKVPPTKSVEGETLIKAVPQGQAIFSWSKRVTMTECDSNGHANTSTYSKIAYQSISHALSQGFAIKLHDKLIHCVVKKCSVQFVAESRVGQLIESVLWQSLDDRLYFIMKRGEKILAYLTIVFFA